MERIGETFQQQTRYARGHLPEGALDWANRPAPYKEYPAAPQLALPAPAAEGGAPLWETLRARRSVRAFGGAPVTLAELGQILWAGQGITKVTRGYALRTAPSAGALYPIETYLVVNSVADLAPGVYHYAVTTHALEQLREGDYREAVARAALDQQMAQTADVVLLWTAVFARAVWKYQQRAYRYIYLDAGHIAQNTALAAVALGLGSCQVAALYDEEANALLGVDGQQESVLYMSVVGRL
jgi:SagB-type dehydrogenase family enzyme